jgi:hypothetical protein
MNETPDEGKEKMSTSEPTQEGEQINSNIDSASKAQTTQDQ